MQRIFVKLAFLLSLLCLSPWCWAEASRDFDGNDDTVSFGDVTIIDGAAALTAIAWLNIDVAAPSSAYSVLRKDGSFNAQFFGGASNDVACSIWATTLGPGRITHTWGTGAWNQYLCRWDNGVIGGDSEIYKDLTSLGTIDGNDTSTIANSANQLRFGGTEASPPVEDYDGKMSYVRYYTRYLTLVELTEEFYRPGIIPANLVGFWPLWGDSTEIDLSGNGNTGTVSGSTANSAGPPIMIGDAPL